MSTSDRALLEHWTEFRDAQAFAELVRRHAAMVHGTCRRILKNEADAEEVAQDCFAALVRDGGGENIRSLGGWLHTLATCRSLDRLRKEKRRRNWKETAAKTASAAIEPDPDDIHMFVDDAIAQLPEKLRVPVVAHFLEGHTHQEIADELDTSRSTVTSRIVRGIDEIRKHLRRKGIPVSASALASLLTAESAHAAPPALVAALGKMALSGGGTTVTGATALTGGILLMKASTISIIAAVLVLAAAITVPLVRHATKRPVPDPGRTVSVMQIASAPADEADEAVAAARPEPAPVAEVSEEGLRVSGFVVDSQGGPLRDASVTLSIVGEPTPKMETVTGEDGAFAFGGLDSGTRFFCRAKKDGMLGMPGSTRRLELADADIEDYLVTLHYAAKVEGKVVDTRGRVVSGTSVVARWFFPDSDSLHGETGETDHAGDFLIENLLPGKHALAVNPDVNGMWLRSDLDDLRIELKEGEHRVGVRLVYDANEPFLAGRVTDETGEPVAGVRVQALLGQEAPTVKTDEDGLYRISRLPEGAYRIMAYHRNYENHMGRPVETGQDGVDIVLKRRPLAEVTVRVIDADTREPIPEFSIRALEGTWHGLTWGSEDDFKKVIDEDGRFILKRVNTNSSTIVVRASGYSIGLFPFQGQDGPADSELTLALQPSPILEGIVVDSGGLPVADAAVFTCELPPLDYWLKDGGLENVKGAAAQMTGQDGKFALDSTPGGIFTLSAFHVDYGLGWQNLGPSGTRPSHIRITLKRGGRIEGTFTMGGAPVAEGRVSIWHKDLGTNYGEVETDANGTYAIEGVPEGLIMVMLQQPGSFPPELERYASREGVIVADGKTTQIDFAFPQGNSKVSGLITILGNPAEDGSLQIVMETSAGTERSGTSIRNGGRFAFWDLPAGPATLVLHASDGEIERRMKTVSIQVPETEDIEVNIDFSGSAVLAGRVEGIAPFEDGTVRIFSGAVDIQTFEQSNLGELQPITQGSAYLQNGQDEYEIRGLEPGTYTVLASCWQRNTHGAMLGEARFATVVVEIAEGEARTLNFDLR